MSAKPAKKPAAKTPSPGPAAGLAPASSTLAPAAAATAETPPPAWIDSPDPKKKRLGQFLLAGVWIYVAALWLLAIDQYFNLGIFGPKIPPLP